MKNLGRNLSIRRALARILIVLLPAAPVLAQQQPPNPVPAPAAQPVPPPAPSGAAAGAPAQPGQTAGPATVTQALKIVPLAGKGEMNDLERRVMAPLVVEVLDQNDRPVEGAEVVFRFPVNGAGATFSDGKSSRTVRTNGQGQAAALNWTANNQTGNFNVHVTVTYGNQGGEIDVPMSNVTRIVEGNNKVVAKHGGWWSPTWVKVAVIGGTVALAAGIALATRGGGSSAGAASQPTVTITPGSPTIGGPH